ncbi:HAD family hydrolase [Afipia carboxidovorans]|uniref:HAD family hydrolase n=1 Tax=Afipia carboxidovorans TaxID=40137 RepID=UPI00309111F6|nr:HAD family hydrolase [Afipia carboxidovorans]
MATSSLIVFDLDGTLVDSAPDLINALNFVLEREGLTPVPLAPARKFIGAGARAMIERALEAEGRTCTPDYVSKMTEDFIVFYGDHLADNTRPFEGTEDALEDLASRGHRLAVCTNKLEWLSKRLLDRLNMSGRFSAICGADTFGVQKPDPIILRQTIARAGGAISSSIMVGDSGTDIGVAKRAGVPVIGVDFGYTPIAIKDLEPDRLISHMRELPATVADMNLKK